MNEESIRQALAEAAPFEPVDDWVIMAKSVIDRLHEYGWVFLLPEGYVVR